MAVPTSAASFTSPIPMPSGRRRAGTSRGRPTSAPDATGHHQGRPPSATAQQPASSAAGPVMRSGMMRCRRSEATMGTSATISTTTAMRPR